jgi:uncharacterized protein YecT (DUF1311 family)
MRTILLVLVAIQLGFAGAALAQDSSDGDHSLNEKLPLYAKNHCSEHKDPANQLFCGDAELSAVGAKLSEAIQGRLGRLADRRMAVEENAEWVKERNLSCGIFGKDPIHFEDIDPIVACLLKESEERIAILRNPNFDCLAANTPAGTLICSEPSLAEGETELNAHVVALIGKLNEDEAKQAFSEYARWVRERDRKCRLAGKDNVPQSELASTEGCLADFIRDKTSEIAAAHGDPKRVFGHPIASALPDADAVDLCVAQIHAANSCDDFLRVKRVFEIDTEVAEGTALVTAEVEMIVLQPFAVCSPIASSCTGTCWDPTTGKPRPSHGSRDSFAVSHRITIEKAFAFQKASNGTWRCNATALPPVDFGVALSGP